MKRSFLILFSLLISVALLSQNYPQGTFNGGSRDAGVTCPVNSIFGQEPFTTDYWATPISDVFDPFDGLWVAHYENFSGLQGEICKVIFWGLPWQRISGTWFPCTENPMTFRISFFDGVGYPGNLVYTFDAPITGAATGVILLESGGQTGELLYYETELPQELVLSSGYISIQGISLQTPDDCGFGWMTSPTGDGFRIFETPQNTFYSSSDNLSLCLGTMCNMSTIPVANWALYLGLGFIVIFTVLRFRAIR